jgi:hypothetical protein
MLLLGIEEKNLYTDRRGASKNSRVFNNYESIT